MFRYRSGTVDYCYDQELVESGIEDSIVDGDPVVEMAHVSAPPAILLRMFEILRQTESGTKVDAEMGGFLDAILSAEFKPISK